MMYNRKSEMQPTQNHPVLCQGYCQTGTDLWGCIFQTSKDYLKMKRMEKKKKKEKAIKVKSRMSSLT